MERARFIPCPSNKEAREGCKYAPNCFVSEHHIYPKRTASSKLERAFGNLAINKIETCRNIHDTLDTFPPPEYPEPEAMKQAIERERGREWR